MLQKKLFTLSFTVFFFFTLILGVSQHNIEAFTGKTQQEAVDWASYQANTNAWLDHDGYYGAQCVDLIMYYYDYLGVSAVSGNGCDYAWNTLPNGWQRIQNTPEFVPQPGDIAIWNSNIGGGNGHVAIVISATVNQLYTVDQNWNQSSCHYVTHTYSNVWGFIRPDFQPAISSPPSNPQAWMSAYIFAVGEYPTFYASADNANHYVLGIDREGVRIDTPDLESNNTYSRSFDQAGNYYYYASCANNFGSVDSPGVTFRVYDSIPRNPRITSSKPMYTTNEEVTINLSADDAVEYYISVFNDNGKVDERSIPWLGSYKNTFTQPGNYSAYMSATNKFGTIDSQWIYFTITDKAPTFAELNVEKTMYTTDETALLIPNSDYGTDYYFAVWDPDDNKIEAHTIRGENLEIKNLKPGKYHGYMSAGNSFGGVDSNWIEFDVVDGTSNR